MPQPRTSFMKGLFFGLLQPSLVHPFPRQEPEERETARMVVDTFRQWASERLDGGRFDREHAVPADIRRELAELGILGLTIPEEFGGASLGYGTYCRIVEECNRWCGSTAVIVGGHQSIGIKALLLHGNGEQQAAWLPKLATGEWMAAYALTEPQAGSDPASLQATADLMPDGSGYVLNGQKIWITNGGFANFISVFAKTLDDKGQRRITCFVLTPAELKEGFKRGAEERKLGLRGSSTTQLFFDGVKVPAFNVLGEKGKGLKVALEVLNYGRTSLAAGCAGASKRMLEEAARHARERVQFGHPLKDFELIQAKLAEMASDTYATESVAYLAAGMADRGDDDFSLEAATAKIFGTEAHWRTTNHAVQVAGGIAYVDEYPYERFLRDARINMIFEGTNEILHHFIALAGLKEPATVLLEEGRTNGALGAGERFGGLHAAIDPAVRELEDLVPRFGGAVERTLQEHGRSLEQRELAQARLSEASMNLLVGFACCSRVDAALKARGEEGAADELAVARKAVRDATGRVRRCLAEIEAPTGEDDAIRHAARVASALETWPFDLVP